LFAHRTTIRPRGWKKAGDIVREVLDEILLRKIPYFGERGRAEEYFQYNLKCAFVINKV
jgi:hypothetical protein